MPENAHMLALESASSTDRVDVVRASGDRAVRAAQDILDQRGYLVVATFELWAIGQVMPTLNWARYPSKPDSRNTPALVIAQTDRADFLEQARLLGREPWLNPRNVPNYYRVVAE